MREKQEEENIRRRETNMVHYNWEQKEENECPDRAKGRERKAKLRRNSLLRLIIASVSVMIPEDMKSVGRGHGRSRPREIPPMVHSIANRDENKVDKHPLYGAEREDKAWIERATRVLKHAFKACK